MTFTLKRLTGLGLLVLAVTPMAGASASIAQRDKLVQFDSVTSKHEYTQASGDVTEEMRAAADIKRLTVDTRSARFLVLGIKMGDIPETPPQTPGTVASYSIDFDTVKPGGLDPIPGRVYYSLREDVLIARSGDNAPCPATVLLERDTDWITFTMKKSCFPGVQRRLVRYAASANSATLEDRDGQLMTGTENEVEDETDPRQAGRLRVR